MIKTETITVGLGARSYNILIGPGLLQQADVQLEHLIHEKQVIIISDTIVGPLYQETLAAKLAPISTKISCLRVPAGEASKSMSVFSQLVEDILAIGIDRGSVLIALGGGVIGDLVGFAAASLLRGLPFIQIPTSLLAQVDSSVGGKTGVNAAAGKNLIGAFHQPKIVLADTDVLATLPRRELISGYAEIVKYGLLGNSDFFEWLDLNANAVLQLEQDKIITAVKISCQMKADIVAQDETETGQRALLNLGHTFAHAFEAVANYNGDLLHGEAVAAGLGLAFDLSVHKNMCNKAQAERVHLHLKQVGLPHDYASLHAGKARVGILLDHMKKDKKTRAGKLTFILADSIGNAHVVPNISSDEITAFFIAKGVNHV